MFNKRQITKALVALAAVAAGAPLVGAGAAVVDIWPAAASPSICTGTIAGVSAYAGGGQVAKVGEAFTSALEAQVVDTGGCPVANVNVDFVAPATGASGTFPGAATTVSVPTGSNGIATAPQLTANSASGSFSVTASVSGPTGTTYSTAFQLTNTTLGAVSTVRASSGNNQSAHIGSTFSSPLSVTVADSYGDPVTGTTVIFTVVTNNGAGASFAGGGASVSEQTSSYGVATSPALTAGDTVGTFTVTATVTGTTEMATFTLTDLAGAPNAITAGVGSSQSTQLGADFTVPLAVTVTDSDGNAVAGARVVFSAPASGPSGVFAGAGRTAIAITNSDGVATAPDFSANQDTGGYVVTASVSGLTPPATFALVNEPRAGVSAPGPAGTYWLVTSGGSILASGSAKDFGSVPSKKLSSPVVGMAAGPSGDGYWLVTADGKVYAFGQAAGYGSVANVHLAAPIVGIAATPDGKGYWLVAADGGVFNYGDARFYGSPAKLHLAAPIVGIAATPDGKGYWLVATDGGVFNYGDARFYGSPAKTGTVAHIVGVAATPDGKGYWLVSSTGAVYNYGTAADFSSGLKLSPLPVRALVRTADGSGYWLVSANGTAAGFGDAGAQGTPAVGAKTVVGGAA